MEFRQTPPFHTFFLPKRERKYQRKRFRAAARTPRGHRSCSALSALEMGHRLQRCYCIPQNEALAPLMGRKTHVFGCSRAVLPKTPEGTWGLGARYPCRRVEKLKHNCTISTAAWGYPEEKCFFKMSAAARIPFSYIFIGEAKKYRPSIAQNLKKWVQRKHSLIRGGL